MMTKLKLGGNFAILGNNCVAAEQLVPHQLFHPLAGNTSWQHWLTLFSQALDRSAPVLVPAGRPAGVFLEDSREHFGKNVHC